MIGECNSKHENAALCVFGLQASHVAGPCFMVRLNVLALASLLADDTVLQLSTVKVNACSLCQGLWVLVLACRLCISWLDKHAEF